MAGLVILGLFLFAFPALALWLAERRIAGIDRVGPAMICYAVGLAVGNTGLVPHGAVAVQDTINTMCVIIAIPLLFFSLQVRGLARSGSSALLSFALETLSVAVVATIGFLLFRGAIGAQAPAVAGMLLGVYTGGTVNLAAIATALRVDPGLYVAANAADIVFSGLYLLFLMSVGKRLMRRFLGRGAEDARQVDAGDPVADTSFRGLLGSGGVGPLAGALGLALLIAAAGAMLALLFPGTTGTVAAILLVTSAGIALSLSARVRRIRYTFALGHYLILVFGLSVGSMANLRAMASSAPAIAGYVAFGIFGSLALHALLAALFRIDAETMIITSVAGICSPPFVPVVASSLGSKRVLVPGVITGIVGWVIGTYIGIGFGLLLGSAR
jgi:uncharacterized membrane protein